MTTLTVVTIDIILRVGRDQMGAEPDIQQATLNLFCDMGVMPGVGRLTQGLVAPEPSHDTEPPTVTSADTGQGVLMVTATDTGGRVAAVEFMLNNDTVWHPAVPTDLGWSIDIVTQQQMESLGYHFKPGTNTIDIRAVDDSYNVGSSFTTSIQV